MRRIALVVVLLGLVGLGVLLSRVERTRVDGSASHAAAPTNWEQPATEELASPAPITAASIAAREALPSSTASHSAETHRRNPSSAGERETIHLSGTIVVVDELGVEHAAEEGIFFLAFEPDTFEPDTSGAPVSVRAGSWSIELSPGWGMGEDRSSTRGLRIRNCFLGGRPATQIENQSEQALGPENPQALRVRWLPDLALEVRERSSGRPLEHVLLYELDGLPDPQKITLHPGLLAESEAQDVGPSPVRLAAHGPWWENTRHIFARGLGLAWGHVALEPTDNEAHVLLLDPGGDLDLVVNGTARDPATELRIIRADALRGRGFIHDAHEQARALALDTPLGGARSLRIDGLPVGRYSVQAEIHPSAPLLVGSCEVDVRANEQVTAVLDLEPPPTSLLVPFEGVLVLPAAWELAHFRLSFVRWGTGQLRELDSAVLVREDDDHYRWALPPVPPGRYDVMLDCGYSFALDTGPAGRHDARIVVPPPCSISVRCVVGSSIDGSGADARPEALSWNAGDERVTNVATWNPEHERWEFRAPAGEVSIRNTGRGYWDSSTKITAAPGTNEVVLRLRKAE